MRSLAPLIALLSLGGIVPGAATTVGTYNIRNDNPADVARGNGWSKRAPVIADLIRFHGFDLLGTQEGFGHQMEDLRKMLPEYDLVSYGRDDGERRGEHIGVFFRKDRFELIESGRFWLSESPDRPGRGWDADLPRICTWAKLKERGEGKIRYVFNLHLDHRGAKSRSESIALVLEKIGSIAGETGAPVYLMGDFNTDQDSDSYRRVVESRRFADPSDHAVIRHAPTGTANKFDPNAMTVSRIDHVFVPKGMSVRRYGVLTDSYRVPRTPEPEESRSGNFPAEVKFTDHEAKLPSDHFPVLVEVDD